MYQVLFMYHYLKNKVCFRAVFKFLFILAALSLHYYMQASLVAKNEGLLLVVVRGLLIAMASLVVGFPDSSASKESACNVGGPSSIPVLGRSPGARERLPTPVFWPGEFHGQSAGSQRVRQDWMTWTPTLTLLLWSTGSRALGLQ